MVNNKYINQEIIIEPENKLEGIQIGRVLGNVNSEAQIPITLANFLDKEVTLHSKDVIGKVVAVDNVISENEPDLFSKDKYSLSNIDLTHLN
jgi:hypothetical protein